MEKLFVEKFDQHSAPRRAVALRLKLLLQRLQDPSLRDWTAEHRLHGPQAQVRVVKSWMLWASGSAKLTPVAPQWIGSSTIWSN